MREQARRPGTGETAFVPQRRWDWTETGAYMRSRGVRVMAELVRDISGYLRAVFVESWRWTAIVFDVVGIVMFCSPSSFERVTQNAALAQAIGGGVFFLSFLVANFLLYREIHVEGADIRLRLVQQSFSPSSGSRQVSAFRHIRRGYLGFNDQGLPDWASLYARIELANVGWEKGTLLWQVDKAKTRLPDLFDLDQSEVSLHPHSSVPPRDAWHQDLFLDVLCTLEDPRSFALALKELVQHKSRYKVVVRYRTKRVDSDTRPRELLIEGDFRGFHEAVLRHWARYGPQELVELARLD